MKLENETKRPFMTIAAADWLIDSAEGVMWNHATIRDHQGSRRG